MENSKENVKRAIVIFKYRAKVERDTGEKRLFVNFMNICEYNSMEF